MDRSKPFLLRSGNLGPSVILQYFSVPRRNDKTSLIHRDRKLSPDNVQYVANVSNAN